VCPPLGREGASLVIRKEGRGMFLVLAAEEKKGK